MGEYHERVILTIKEAFGQFSTRSMLFFSVFILV